MASALASIAARFDIPIAETAIAARAELALPSVPLAGAPQATSASRLGAGEVRMRAPVSYAFDRMPVAGYQYHHGESVWSLLAEGQALDLAREPGNSHDAGAIRVDWRGVKLAYVPRACNAALANLMDHGVVASARIAGLVNTPVPWERISMAIEIAIEA